MGGNFCHGISHARMKGKSSTAGMKRYQEGDLSQSGEGNGRQKTPDIGCSARSEGRNTTGESEYLLCLGSHMNSWRGTHENKGSCEQTGNKLLCCCTNG